MKFSRLLSTFTLSLMIGLASVAQAQAVWNDGVYHPGLSPAPTMSFDDGANALRQDIGFHVNPEDITRSYVLVPLAQRIFAQAAPLRSRMPTFTPGLFRPIVTDIANFMDRKQKERGFSTEKSNGISNWALAIRLTRLAFCFDTDPRGVAAQVFVESSFNRGKVSPTGAVGFTQMTSAAIDEVNDQFGARGGRETRLDNIPYILSAIKCYTGGKAFVPMFMDGTIPKGKLVSNSSRLRSRAKAWLRANIDRDLIYGQITLKVLLGNARDHGLVGEAAYRDALTRYNGEAGQGAIRYTRDVMQTMRTF